MAKREAVKVRGVYEKVPGSGIWWVQYKQGAIRKREKAGTKQNAINLYQTRKAALLAGAKLPPNLRTKGVTFSKLAEQALLWSEEHHPKDIRNVKSRMATLVKEFGEMAATDLKASDIDKWLTSNAQWAPATKNRYRALISLTYRQGQRSGAVSVNPARLVAARAENNGRVRYLIDTEEVAIRQVLKRKYPMHIPAFDVALYSGMRKSEQFSLTWEQIDFERREINLTLTKNGSHRTVPLHPNAAKAFETLKAEGQTGADRVFRSFRGEPLDNPRKWFQVAMDEAKIKGFRWHDLRHSFCSRLSMAGVDIRQIAQLAGHKTLSMSMRYSHLSPSSNQAAIEKI